MIAELIALARDLTNLETRVHHLEEEKPHA